MNDKITALGKPITLRQFAEMLKRIQSCKDRGENIDSILAREYLLEQRTAEVREETFVEAVWDNDNYTWVNIQSDNPKPLKQKFRKLPVGAAYKCLETGEIYYLGLGEIYDWTEERCAMPMKIPWDRVVLDKDLRLKVV